MWADLDVFAGDGFGTLRDWVIFKSYLSSFVSFAFTETRLELILSRTDVLLRWHGGSLRLYGTLRFKVSM